MSLNAKLQELRRRKGQSLQAVADAVKVSKAHIWELEKGTSKNPGLELLVKLAAHFGVTVAYLTDEESDPKDAASKQFFREYDGKLSQEDWDVLTSMAERLKES
ncbi:MAG: hypothetical protein Salg2KO_19380 [Salibacteraceae bacterium]